MRGSLCADGALRRASPRAEIGVLELSTKCIVEGDRCEIILQSQSLQNSGVDAQRDGRVAAFNSVQSLACDSCSLGNCFSRIGTAQPRFLKVLPETCDQSSEPRKDRWYLPSHTESYHTLNWTVVYNI